MANINNLKIEIENGEQLDYNKPEDLGIKLNRITEDFQNPAKRFGEFSYTFSLPRTKNNDRIFEYPDVKGRTKIFIGKSFECKVFNNNTLLIDGIIELSGVSPDTYECQFYSKFTQLVDNIGGGFISDVNAIPFISNSDIDSNDYEKWIIKHIEADYKNSDEAYFQFPLIFYRTKYTPDSVLREPSQNSRSNKISIIVNSKSNFSADPLRNWFYYHELPPAFYVAPILKKIFENAGWSLEGSWINRSEVKKLIIPYVSDGSLEYNRTTVDSVLGLDLNTLLPKIKQIDFLKNIINLFNLYFDIDVTTKKFVLEDYNVYFSTTDNPYDITKKVDDNSVNKNYEFDKNIIIQFSNSDNNKQIGGYNRPINSLINEEPKSIENVIFGADFTALIFQFYQQDAEPLSYNKTDGIKNITVQFEAPNLLSTALLNCYNRVGSLQFSGNTAYLPISIPIISKQTFKNDEGYKFYDETGTTFTANSPDTMQFSGSIQLMYYYGQVKFNGDAATYMRPIDEFFGGITWNGNFQDWCYINIATGGTGSEPTGKFVKLPVASPYQLLNNAKINGLREYMVNELLSNGGLLTYRGAEIQNLLRTYYMAGNTSDNYETTPYSLTLGAGEDLLYDTIYTHYHKPKYDNLTNGNKLKCRMLMDENDWREMTIDRPIRFNDELYRLISIKNYDPILNTATLELLKKV